MAKKRQENSGRRAQKKRARSGEIAYQNKDIVSKRFAELFPKLSLDVYGVKTPKITELLPTNMPAIKVNELRLDNFFHFEDGSYGIIDYESKYSKADKVKYLNYLTRAFKRLENEENLHLRMIVIYTADVERSKVQSSLDVGGFTVTLEQAFLSELDSEHIFQNIKRKIEAREALSEAEQMQFILKVDKTPTSAGGEYIKN